MKKIGILLLLGASVVLSNNVFAQATKPGDINIDIGIGFGLYGTSQSNTYKITADINGVPFSDSNTRDTTDGAASTVIPINIEYVLSNKFGAGLDITYNNYFIDSDDREYTDNVRAYDFGLKFHYHPLSSDVYDLVIGLGGGISMIKWNFNSVFDPSSGIYSTASSASGTGFYWNLDIKNKFYFGNHFGMFLSMGYKGYAYPSIGRDNSELEAVFNSIPGVSNTKVEDDLNWKLNGANIMIGLAVKF